MGFVRPEIIQGIRRYRDAMIGAVVSVLGVGWALSSVGFMSTLGMVVSVAGALLLFAGIQRARFALGRHGRGVVAIDEGKVTYYGPDGGGSVDIDDLLQVDLAPAAHDDDDAEWLLLADEAPAPLRIPVEAVGADKLFDVFSRLDGIRIPRLLAQINQVDHHQVVIWRSRRLAAD